HHRVDGRVGRDDDGVSGGGQWQESGAGDDRQGRPAAEGGGLHCRPLLRTAPPGASRNLRAPACAAQNLKPVRRPILVMPALWRARSAFDMWSRKIDRLTTGVTR